MLPIGRSAARPGPQQPRLQPDRPNESQRPFPVRTCSAGAPHVPCRSSLDCNRTVQMNPSILFSFGPAPALAPTFNHAPQRMLAGRRGSFQTTDVRRTAFISLLLVLATVAAYWPLRSCGFVNFDDPLY